MNNLKRFSINSITVIFLIFIFLNIYLRLPVLDFYSVSSKEYKLPMINKGFIPQGIFYEESLDVIFSTGYMKDKSASPIFVMDRETGNLKKQVYLKLPDGSDFNGHGGGVAVLDGKVFVAGDIACIYVVDIEKLNNAENKAHVECDAVIDLAKGEDNLLPAYVAVKGDRLLIGEFYREQNYKTNAMHTVETADGLNHALIVEFEVDGYNIEPVTAYSVPDKIQGVYMDDDKVLLSESYAVAFSKIMTFDISKSVNTVTKNILGKDIKVTILDSTNRISVKKLPPMLEEIDCVNGRIYTIYESASKKYHFGKVTDASKIRSVPIEYFEN